MAQRSSGLLGKNLDLRPGLVTQELQGLPLTQPLGFSLHICVIQVTTLTLGQSQEGLKPILCTQIHMCAYIILKGAKKEGLMKKLYMNFKFLAQKYNDPLNCFHEWCICINIHTLHALCCLLSKSSAGVVIVIVIIAQICNLIFLVYVGYLFTLL